MTTVQFVFWAALVTSFFSGLGAFMRLVNFTLRWHALVLIWED